MSLCVVIEMRREMIYLCQGAHTQEIWEMIESGLFGWLVGLGWFLFSFSFCFVCFFFTGIFCYRFGPDNARVACKLKIENTVSKTSDSKGLSERVQVG